MTFNNVNGKLFPSGPGGWNADPANVIIVSAAPSTAAVENRIGTLAIVPSTGTVYCCSNNTGLNGTVTWTALGGGASAVATINSNAPVAGNYVLAGTANQIAVAQTAGTTTFTLPAVVTAPGSIAATTTLTATLGDITATNGNFVASTAGSGISVPAATVGPGASPQTSNARAGSVVFSGVSIAAAADQTFVINNTTITGATTRVLYTLSGAVTGSALSIKSITQAANSSTIVVTNGPAAVTTTQNGNLTFDYIVLN